MILHLSVLRFRRYLTLAYTVFALFTIYNTASAFPTGFLEGLSNIANGEGDLTDICGVLYVPCIVTFILTRRTWLKCVTGGIWVLDLAVDPAYWVHHIIGTLVIGGLVYFARWLIAKFRKAE